MKYRSEIFFGERYRNPVAVMKHECFELGNIDIPETLMEGILKDHPIKVELAELVKLIEKDEIDILIEEENFSLEENNIFHKIIQAIKDVTGKEITHCLWLIDTKEDLYYEYDLHHELTEEYIDAYEESDIILSDLGTGGKLYGYTFDPEKIT